VLVPFSCQDAKLSDVFEECPWVLEGNQLVLGENNEQPNDKKDTLIMIKKCAQIRYKTNLCKKHNKVVKTLVVLVRFHFKDNPRRVIMTMLLQKLKHGFKS